MCAVPPRPRLAVQRVGGRPGAPIVLPPIREPASAARARQFQARRDMMGADGHGAALMAALGIDPCQPVALAEAEAELSDLARRDLTAARCGRTDGCRS